MLCFLRRRMVEVFKEGLCSLCCPYLHVAVLCVGVGGAAGGAVLSGLALALAGDELLLLLVESVEPDAPQPLRLASRWRAVTCSHTVIQGNRQALHWMIRKLQQGNYAHRLA